VAIAAITASELLHGVERARTPAARTTRGRFVEALLEAIPVLPFGPAEARAHAAAWAALAGKGTVIGAHDLLVAATALAAGYRVATLNRREFSRVAGLQLAPMEPYLRGGPGTG
jgi:predicted nucleic acid-binding protein